MISRVDVGGNTLRRNRADGDTSIHHHIQREPFARPRGGFVWTSPLERGTTRTIAQHAGGGVYANDGIRKWVLLGTEIGGEGGCDIRRDTVGGNESVLPLANSRQSDQSIPVEMKNLVQGEAKEQVITPATLQTGQLRVFDQMGLNFSRSLILSPVGQ